MDDHEYEKRLAAAEHECEKLYEMISTRDKLVNTCKYASDSKHLNSSEVCNAITHVEHIIDELTRRIETVQSENIIEDIILEYSTSHAKTTLPSQPPPSSCSQTAPVNTTEDAPVPVIKNIPRGLECFGFEFDENLPAGLQDSTIVDYACTSCGSTEYVVEDCSSSRICCECGLSSYFSEMTVKNLPYGDYPRPIVSGQYKRINHFREWLSTMQGVESTQILDENMEQIRKQIFEVWGYSEENITPTVVTSSLRSLGYTQLYDHSVKIYTILTGRITFRLTISEEECLQNMFRQCEQLFENIPREYLINHVNRPTKTVYYRKNFPAYSYMIYKFFELLYGKGTDKFNEYTRYLKIPKAKQILDSHDNIWMYMCKKKNWKYYPTSNRTK